MMQRRRGPAGAPAADVVADERKRGDQHDPATDVEEDACRSPPRPTADHEAEGEDEDEDEDDEAEAEAEEEERSNISTTMNIYSHVTPIMQRSAADRFAQLLG